MKAVLEVEAEAEIQAALYEKTPAHIALRSLFSSRILGFDPCRGLLT